MKNDIQKAIERGKQIMKEIAEKDAAISKNKIPSNPSFRAAFEMNNELFGIQEKKKENKPKKSKAGKASGEARRTWKRKFLEWYEKQPKQKFDKKIPLSQLINNFIRQNPTAPKKAGTYYVYLD
jgi:hypothetical protein